jgi:hypothetical protein
MTGARQRIYPQDDERPPDAIEKQKLERENNELRRQVRNLESALRCAARTLQPYANKREDHRR